MMRGARSTDARIAGGWFGRLIDAGAVTSMQAWSVGFNNRYFTNAAYAQPMVLSSLSDFKFRDRSFGALTCTTGTCEGTLSGDVTADASDDSAFARSIVQELAGQKDDIPFNDALAGVTTGNFSAVAMLTQMSNAIPASDLSLFKPSTDVISDGIQGSLLDIARVITYANSGSAPAELSSNSLFFATSLGGWDTHDSEAAAGVLPRRINVLSGALSGLLLKLKAINQLNNTAIVLQSEFGRTVRQNGSFGADHGWGSDTIVLGGGITKTVHGPEATILGNNFTAQVANTAVIKSLLSAAGVTSSQLDQIFPDAYPGDAALNLFS